ncbi:hypothetical protein ACLOJK_031741 [Asimina triloba]
MAVAPPPPPAAMQASLYVGDLHPDVTDGQLLESFSVVGILASVRICRDSNTGRSLGYGYVNYITPEDATRAIEKLNHTPLNGQLIRIMWSERDPGARKNGIGNLFVKNLNESINNVKLHDMFAKFGKILSCKVVMSQDGKSKGYGFVQFQSDESANAAIENANGSVVEGKQICNQHMSLSHFVRKSERVAPIPDIKYTNLYMKNLDIEITEEFLQDKFSKFGKITNLAIAKDVKGNSRGFGFVNFENPDDAKNAMEAMNGALLGTKALYVARAQKKAEREQVLRRQFEERRNELGSNVYVKNIDDGIDDDELQELFSQCGTITSAKLMRNDKGISRGFGFVCFSTSEEANKAVNTFNGYMFHGKPLYVAIAQRKEDRRAQLQLQYNQRMQALTGHPATVIPAGYPPLYYSPPGVAPQIPTRQGIMYQPLGLRPGWRANGFSPSQRPPFRALPFNAVSIETRSA